MFLKLCLLAFVVGFIIPASLIVIEKMFSQSRRWISALYMRRFRLAAITGYIAYGDRVVALATIAPKLRKRLWHHNWRRPRLMRRVNYLEERLGLAD